MASTDAEGIDDDRLVAALRPIRVLSEVAKTIKGHVEIALNKKSAPLFSVASNAYQRISGRLLIAGETVVVGQLQRIGGATGNAAYYISRDVLVDCIAAWLGKN